VYRFHDSLCGFKPADGVFHLGRFLKVGHQITFAEVDVLLNVLLPKPFSDLVLLLFPNTLLTDEFI
jgi:hypothetical protein